MCKAANEAMDLLVKALVAIESEEECKSFLEDLMTKKEMIEIIKRFEEDEWKDLQECEAKVENSKGSSFDKNWWEYATELQRRRRAALSQLMDELKIPIERFKKRRC